ncbi:hypothetical protein BC938DRAFT_481269 [Jimgerdemannia flammicorona]|uniref:Uncharacterized protein n=1 Tax=Jimgerdemannia flammicorona TaxID=994334 RepID=A0A433QGJ9_9FUNG|nr:hypothetical protein BC938DRAFT_481269 [Jimgerdemannia flammicorona]
MLAPFNWSTYNTTTTKPSPSPSVELPFYFLCRLFNDLEIAEQCTAKTIRYSKTEFAFTKWLDARHVVGFLGNALGFELRQSIRRASTYPKLTCLTAQHFALYILLHHHSRDLQEDISRKYSLKEAALVPLLAYALALTGTTRGRLLSEWRIPTATNGIPCDLAGNLGSVVEWVVRASDRGQVSGLTVREVNAALTELASHSGFSDLEGWTREGPPAERAHESSDPDRTVLRKPTSAYAIPPPRREDSLIINPHFHHNQQMSSLEAKWITRIILKNMSPLRLSVWVFLRIYHPMMPAVYHMHTDLKIACERIEEVIARGTLLTFYDPNSSPGVDSRTEAGRADFAAEFLKPVVGVNVEVGGADFEGFPYE